MRERRFITKVRKKVDEEFDRDNLWLITLTYGEAPLSMNLLHEDVSCFITKLKVMSGTSLCYVAVPREDKGGRYFCEVLTDMPRASVLDVKEEKAQKLWPHGVLKVRYVRYCRVPELARLWAASDISRAGMWTSRKRKVENA